MKGMGGTMKRGILLAVSAMLIAPSAYADFHSSSSRGFRTSADRMAQLSAESLRIQAENVYLQQQMMLESLQRGENINNLILINQTGNGTINLDAIQRNSGNQTIDNDITGSIGLGY